MSNNPWRRLSPFAIVYFTGRTLGQLVGAVPLMALGLLAIAQSDWQSLVIYGGAGALLVVLFATLFFLNFYYVQQDDRFLIRKGVLSTNLTEVPFSKIQNLNIKQPFYFRPLDLVVLTIDSAGSSQAEVEIAALRSADANRIKAEVMAFQRAAPTAAIKVETAPNAEMACLLLRRSFSDIIIHGFTNNRAWLLLAFLAPVAGQLDELLLALFARFELDLEQWFAAQSLLLVLLVFVAAVVGVFVLISILSVLGSVVALFHYRLLFDKQVYTRKSGLLSRYEVQIKRSRVQTLKYMQTGLDLLFDRINLVLEPFSSGSQDNHKSRFMQKILVPSLTAQEAPGLVGHIYPQLDIKQVIFRAISRYYIWQKMLFGAVPVALLSTALVHGQPLLQSILGLTVFCALMLLVWLRWMRYGVGICGDYIVMRSGLLGVVIICLPVHKVQQVKFLQSLFLRRRGLASLQLVASSRTVTLPFIPAELAEQLLDRVLAEVENSESSWM